MTGFQDVERSGWEIIPAADDLETITDVSPYLVARSGTVIPEALSSYIFAFRSQIWTFQ
jgi:hypothetical protein